ncbi:MAG: non-canonical purine NTP pyrophosphatase [Planctomycetota bacterium]
MQNVDPIPTGPPHDDPDNLGGPAETLDLSEIVLATGNPHKVAELRAIFDRALAARDGTPMIDVKALDDFPGGGFIEPVEDGADFVANATIKAVSYAEQTGRPCLADDSGLEVDALGGAPGVISSHYFNEGRTDGAAEGMGRADRDRANNERLLSELDGVAPEARTARFVCVMVLALPPEGAHLGRPIAQVRGTFEGRIGLPHGEHPIPRGEYGFGYDPLFLVAPKFDRTGAELPAEEKNRLSHRGQAAAMMARELKRLLS